MPSDQYAIEAQNLSKAYKIFNKPSDRLKQFAINQLPSFAQRATSRYYEEFWALKNITFKVTKGETLGVIGHNGSGKSTLLQIICGTLAPTTGYVSTQGRIAALLELGSGFNPEFTGSENIFMNGAILGLTHKELEDRFDNIAAFADIGDFINRPVKTYSSGMMVRLAFAVQSQIDPDVLIIDEALAVGDAKFQAKCFDRLCQLKENGTSILLVTHSVDQIVTHCDRALLLDSGQQLMLTEPRTVTNHYLDILFGREKRTTDEQINTTHVTPSNLDLSISIDRYSERDFYNPNEYRWGDGAACITDFELTNKTKNPNRHVIDCGDWIQLRVAIRFDLNIIEPIFGVTIKNKEGITIFGTNTLIQSHHEFTQLGSPNSSCIIAADIHCILNHGDYFISLGLASKDGEAVIPHDRRYDSIHFQISPTQELLGIVKLDTNLRIEHS
jgi:lipopolysaccharide transport system ATP-binding protein